MYFKGLRFVGAVLTDVEEGEDFGGDRVVDVAGDERRSGGAVQRRGRRRLRLDAQVLETSVELSETACRKME